MRVSEFKPWPGLLDRYLVGRSFGNTHEPRDPPEPDNLWHPAPGDWSAHGPFDVDAQDHSWQIRLSRHRTALSLLALGTAGVAATLWLRRSPAHSSRRSPPAPPASPSPRTSPYTLAGTPEVMTSSLPASERSR